MQNPAVRKVNFHTNRFAKVLRSASSQTQMKKQMHAHIRNCNKMKTKVWGT